jgi:hypothetical protein
MEEKRPTAQELETEHQEGVLADEQVLCRVPALLAGMDQPLADQALISLHREAAALVAEHRAGTRDASGAIWPLLAFGLWLDRIRGRDVS